MRNKWMNDMSQYCCDDKDWNTIEYNKAVSAYIKYYHIRAKRCKYAYYVLSLIKIMLVGTLPVLQAVGIIDTCSWLVAAFSSGILILESTMELFKLRDKWRLYRNTCNQLMTVQRKYTGERVSIFEAKTKAKEYIATAEAIINGEAGMWLEISKDTKENKESRE